VFLVQPLTPSVNEGLVELLVHSDGYRGKGVTRIVAVVPYRGNRLTFGTLRNPSVSLWPNNDRRTGSGQNSLWLSAFNASRRRLGPMPLSNFMKKLLTND
jgi:hypothetical protein